MKGLNVLTGENLPSLKKQIFLAEPPLSCQSTSANCCLSLCLCFFLSPPQYKAVRWLTVAAYVSYFWKTSVSSGKTIKQNRQRACNHINTIKQLKQMFPGAHTAVMTSVFKMHPVTSSRLIVPLYVPGLSSVSSSLRCLSGWRSFCDTEFVCQSQY